MFKYFGIILLCTCLSVSYDTGTRVSYSSETPCGPEIWQIKCNGCIDKVSEEYEPVVVICEISNDPQLDALELTFGDFGIWREEFSSYDLTLTQDDKLEVDWKKWVETGPRY